MPELDIEVDGLDKVIRRMQGFPKEYKVQARRTMVASLITLQERVPPYPPQQPGSSYFRTGLLGRSLGASMQGTRFGVPNVRQTKFLARGTVVGTFGTKTKYAPDVIGETTQTAEFKARGWWTMRTIRDAAEEKITRLWTEFTEDMARWLDS